MEFNIFKGSRRIALVILMAFVVYMCHEIINASTHIELNYDYDGKFTKAASISARSTSNSGIVWDNCSDVIFEASHKSSDDVWIRVCLLNQTVYLWKPGHPLKKKSAPYLDGKSYSEKQSLLKSQFKFSPKDEEFIEKEVNSHKLSMWESNLKATSVYLPILYGIVWVIGWIVRGFLGIPNGMDRKP